MEREELIGIIKEYVADLLDADIDTISENSSLMDEYELSSLEIMTMLAELEEKIGTSIEPEKLTSVESINDLVDVIEANM